MEARPILVLDAYGVVYRPGDDVAGVLLPFVAERGGLRDPERIRALYRDASLGLMTARSFWNAVHVDPGMEDEYLCRIELAPGAHDFLRSAAGHFAALACLTNDVAAWSRKLRERHGLAAAIPTWVVSGDVGLRKPAPEIYALLLRRLGVSGDQVVFVDDKIANLDAARALGIRTVWLNPEGGEDQGHTIVRSLAEVLSLAPLG